jgi:hypothetical protein
MKKATSSRTMRSTSRQRESSLWSKIRDTVLEAGLVADLRALNVTPLVAQNPANRRSAIDGRITRHPGYAASQRSASGSRRASRRTARAKRGRVQTPSGAGASSRAEAQAGAQRRDAALGEGLLAPAGGPGDAVRVDVLGVPPPRDG